MQRSVQRLGGSVKTLCRQGVNCRQSNQRSLSPLFAATFGNRYKSTMSLKSQAEVLVAMPPTDVQISEPFDADPVSSLLEEILSRPNVHIKNEATTELKLRELYHGGYERLMVISDFDFTLSRYHDNEGERCWSTHGLMDHAVAPEVSAKLKALNSKYHPIEFDPHLTDEEKTPMMEDWWNTSHSYIVKSGFKKSTIADLVTKSRIILRDGAEALIRELDEVRIPLVIFSAGIGNVIELYLEALLGEFPQTAHIISNMMQFDDDGKVCGFSEPLIHTFCKNSSAVRNEAEFFHKVSGRTNVILLGDSMGDIHMDVGVERDGVTLKIGFLNDRVDELMEKYLDSYDIVIVMDQTVNVPTKIVNTVLQKLP